MNGREINGIDPPQHRCFHRFYSDIGFTIYNEFKNKDIETVVTKEQMRKMEYKYKNKRS